MQNQHQHFVDQTNSVIINNNNKVISPHYYNCFLKTANLYKLLLLTLMA